MVLVAGLKFHEMILGHPSTMVEYPTFLPMGTPWSPGQNRWPRLHCGQAPKEFDIAQPVVVTKVPQQYVIAGRQADDGRARTAAGKREKGTPRATWSFLVSGGLLCARPAPLEPLRLIIGSSAGSIIQYWGRHAASELSLGSGQDSSNAVVVKVGVFHVVTEGSPVQYRKGQNHIPPFYYEA